MVLATASTDARLLLDAFLAPAAVNASLITSVSGFFAAAALVSSAGRTDVYDQLARAVNYGLAAGFLIAPLPTLFSLVIALQSVA
jgi:hypothetical protein